MVRGVACFPAQPVKHVPIADMPNAAARRRHATHASEKCSSPFFLDFSSPVAARAVRPGRKMVFVNADRGVTLPHRQFASRLRGSRVSVALDPLKSVSDMDGNDQLASPTAGPLAPRADCPEDG